MMGKLLIWYNSIRETSHHQYIVFIYDFMYKSFIITYTQIGY